MVVIIPEWFFGFDSVMYLISALVGFLLSFYFHRMYSISSERKHLYLHLGFLLLSVGLLTLSVTNIFSYTTFWNCQSMHTPCILSLLDDVSSLDDFAYLAYFGLSLFAYSLFILAYSGEYAKLSKGITLAIIIYIILIAVSIPINEGGVLSEPYSGYFHLTALIMLVFVSFRNFVNYSETKNSNSLLVAFSFSSISLFHLFHMFSFLSGWMYIFGHIALLAGFIALLAMVARVKSK